MNGSVGRGITRHRGVMTGYLVATAVVPALLLMWYFHSRDVYKEPSRVLWGTFGWGVLSIIPAVLVGMWIDRSFAWVTQPYWSAAVGAFLVAGVPEEFWKLAVLLGYSCRKHEFDEPMDGVVYGVAASLGFATLENVMYVLDGGMGVGIARGLMSVPVHAFMGAIMGYYVGRAGTIRPRRNGLILKGFALAVLVHTFYDYPILLIEALRTSAQHSTDKANDAAVLLALTSVGVVILGWRWANHLVRGLRREQLLVAGTSEDHAESGRAPAVGQTARGVNHRAGRGRFAGTALVVAGSLVTCAAGIVLMILATAVVADWRTLTDKWAYFVAAALLGVLPLTLGLWAFLRGVGLLNAISSVENAMPITDVSGDRH